MAFKASPSSQHQHCTELKAETVLSAVIYTPILRKVVGKSARDNPEKYSG